MKQSFSFSSLPPPPPPPVPQDFPLLSTTSLSSSSLSLTISGQHSGCSFHSLDDGVRLSLGTREKLDRSATIRIAKRTKPVGMPKIDFFTPTTPLSQSQSPGNPDSSTKQSYQRRSFTDIPTNPSGLLRLPPAPKPNHPLNSRPPLPSYNRPPLPPAPSTGTKPEIIKSAPVHHNQEHKHVSYLDAKTTSPDNAVDETPMIFPTFVHGWKSGYIAPILSIPVPKQPQNQISNLDSSSHDEDNSKPFYSSSTACEAQDSKQQRVKRTPMLNHIDSTSTTSFKMVSSPVICTLSSVDLSHAQTSQIVTVVDAKQVHETSNMVQTTAQRRRSSLLSTEKPSLDMGDTKIEVDVADLLDGTKKFAINGKGDVTYEINGCVCAYEYGFVLSATRISGKKKKKVYIKMVDTGAEPYKAISKYVNPMHTEMTMLSSGKGKHLPEFIESFMESEYLVIVTKTHGQKKKPYIPFSKEYRDVHWVYFLNQTC